MIGDAELKRRLGLIIAQEEKPDADWGVIGRLCDHLAEDAGIGAPMIVQEYLASFERRRVDGVFAHAQRSELIRYIRG